MSAFIVRALYFIKPSVEIPFPFGVLCCKSISVIDLPVKANTNTYFQYIYKNRVTIYVTMQKGVYNQLKNNQIPEVDDRINLRQDRILSKISVDELLVCLPVVRY